MLDSLLTIEIYLPHQITEDEASYLIKQAECTELALSKFVAGDISFQDYIDILELCDVNIDDYLLIVEDNLEVVGL